MYRRYKNTSVGLAAKHEWVLPAVRDYRTFHKPTYHYLLHYGLLWQNIKGMSSPQQARQMFYYFGKVFVALVGNNFCPVLDKFDIIVLPQFYKFLRVPGFKVNLFQMFSLLQEWFSTDVEEKAKSTVS